MASSIFNLPRSSTKPKLNVSHAEIPSNYLDPSQPPQSRIPFRQIISSPCCQAISICMPRRTYRQLSQSTDLDLAVSTTYHKVILSLHDILMSYELRTGNYILLCRDSEKDTSMQLSAGTLTLNMTYAVYQRSGLPFQHSTTPSGGRKHEKSSQNYRYVIDLRSASMVRGKKAFDRLVYAAQNVKGLSESKVWVCAELGQTSKKRKRDEDHMDLKDLLVKHHPTTIVQDSQGVVQADVLVPGLLQESSLLRKMFEDSTEANNRRKGDLPTVIEDDFYDVVEYLSMLAVKSPRIERDEYKKADTSICSYEIPDVGLSVQHNDGRQVSAESDDKKLRSEDIAHFSFDGLIPSDFVMHTVVDLVRRSRSIDEGSEPEKVEAEAEASRFDSTHWVAITVKSHNLEARHGIDGYAILLQSRASVTSLHGTIENEQRNGDFIQQASQVRQEESSLPKDSLALATCFEFVETLT